ncbi:MAG: co-chaperone GroES [Candidatus Margulisbacteria bacterium]|nr:co-chaperone GroES [Candidatus Margulisiibacteriota bacterium]
MLKPLGDKVIVKPSKGEEKTKSGIVLPDSAKDKPNEGEIVAAGPGKKTDDGKVIPLDVKKGDVVVYTSYSGTKIKINDEEYLIISESDILAKK